VGRYVELRLWLTDNLRQARDAEAGQLERVCKAVRAWVCRRINSALEPTKYIYFLNRTLLAPEPPLSIYLEDTVTIHAAIRLLWLRYLNELGKCELHLGRVRA